MKKRPAATLDIPRLKETTFAKVSDDKAFAVCRGDRISTLSDLAGCIESLTPEQFSYHVNKEKNDFAKWIEDVLANPVLAHDLRYAANVKDKARYVKAIRDHLKWLEWE